MGGLIGEATKTKNGLATRTTVKAAGLCIRVASDNCLKIERSTSGNAPVFINITSYNSPTWATDAKPRKLSLSIPFDTGTITNIYAKNLLDADNMQIYKDDSFNIYIKAMDAFSTVFIVEIIQSVDIFSNVYNIPLSNVPDLESYEKITVH